MNILLIGNVGASNLGDEAIFRGIVSFLRKTYPTHQLSALSASPKETSKRFALPVAAMLPMGIRSWLKSPLTKPKTDRFYRSADIVLQGGGGLYTDETTPFAITLWSTHLTKAQHLKKPTYGIGQSLGPITTKSAQQTTIQSFNHCHSLLFRDTQSVQLAKSLGITTPIYNAPDAAFLNPIPKSIPQANRKNRIIISLRPWKALPADIVQSLTTALTPYTKAYELCFLPMQREREGDISLFNALQKYLPLTLLSPQDDQDAERLIGEASFVIAMRLHATIFATRTATPFLALGYSSKTQSFVESLDLPVPLYLPIQETNNSTLTTHIETLIKHSSQLQEHLTQKANLLHKAAQEGYKAFLDPILD